MTPRHDLAPFAEILRHRRLRVMFSACLLGRECTWDGKGFTVALLRRIADHPKVQQVSFCPEHFSFGTPRAFSSIHGGHGDDVLDGRARVMAVDGTDWTAGAIAGAQAMARTAIEHAADLAIMLDISPACGSHVVYLGDPAAKVYQRGRGVAAAVIARAGIPIIAQRDHQSIQHLLKLLDPEYEIDNSVSDFVDVPWYREYFKIGQAP